MSLLRFQRIWNDGQPGWGQHSFNDAVNAGHTPSEISAFVNSGQIRIGKKAQDMAYGAAQASRNMAPAYPDLSGQLAAAQALSQGYQSQLQGYQSQLNDWSNRFNNVTNQYQTALTDKAEAEGRATEWEDKWKQSQSAYEEAKALAESYKQEAVDTQLEGLRTGATVQGGQISPYIGLAGGPGSVPRSRGDRERMLDIDKKISAEDSVLSRSGPVVERMRSPSSNSSSEAARRNLAGSGSGGAYYAGRFG